MYLENHGIGDFCKESISAYVLQTPYTWYTPNPPPQKKKKPDSFLFENQHINENMFYRMMFYKVQRRIWSLIDTKAVKSNSEKSKRKMV